MNFEYIKQRLRKASFLAKQGTPATLAIVDDAETELSVRFPEDLRNYLATFGWLEVGHWELMGLGEGIPDYLNIVVVTRSERDEVMPPLPPHLLPLLNDGAGNLTCVVVGESAAAGSIVFWDHERGAQQTPTTVATDLYAWIGELLSKAEEC